MELSQEERELEKKRRRLILNAWVLFEITGQSPPPKKDYCQLIVTTEGVVFRRWEIVLRKGAPIYPLENIVSRVDVPDDERLLSDVERHFGKDIKDKVIHLSTESQDFISKLPDKILIRIASFLSLEDLIALAHTCRTFRRICLVDSLWKTIYLSHNRTLNPAIEQLAEEYSWRKLFFTNKLKLQMLLSRQRSQIFLTNANIPPAPQPATQELKKPNAAPEVMVQQEL